MTAYLKQTRQPKPEVQLKAESLMSAGYQRLLTFEHAGGGYSWFGDARRAFGFPARALPLVFGRPLSYKIQVKSRCEDLEECK